MQEYKVKLEVFEGPLAQRADDLRREGQTVMAVIFDGAVVGLIGVAISSLVGMTVGTIAGYVGGRTDAILMRLCEVMMALPAFYFLLALAAVAVLGATALSSTDADARGGHGGAGAGGPGIAVVRAHQFPADE